MELYNVSFIAKKHSILLDVFNKKEQWRSPLLF